MCKESFVLFVLAGRQFFHFRLLFWKISPFSLIFDGRCCKSFFILVGFLREPPHFHQFFVVGCGKFIFSIKNYPLVKDKIYYVNVSSETRVEAFLVNVVVV